VSAYWHALLSALEWELRSQLANDLPESIETIKQTTYAAACSSGDAFWYHRLCLVLARSIPPNNEMGKSMKAMELAVAQKDGRCNIPVTLITPKYPLLFLVISAPARRRLSRLASCLFFFPMEDTRASSVRAAMEETRGAL